MTSICKRLCSCFYPRPIKPIIKEVGSQEFQVAIGNTKRHRKLDSTEMVSARAIVRWDETSFQKYVNERRPNDNLTS